MIAQPTPAAVTSLPVLLCSVNLGIPACFTSCLCSLSIHLFSIIQSVLSETYTPFHYNSGAGIFESPFTTSDLTASRCVCSGKHGRQQPRDVSMTSVWTSSEVFRVGSSKCNWMQHHTLGCSLLICRIGFVLSADEHSSYYCVLINEAPTNGAQMRVSTSISSPISHNTHDLVTSTRPPLNNGHSTTLTTDAKR